MVTGSQAGYRNIPPDASMRGPDNGLTSLTFDDDGDVASTFRQVAEATRYRPLCFLAQEPNARLPPD